MSNVIILFLFFWLLGLWAGFQVGHAFISTVSKTATDVCMEPRCRQKLLIKHVIHWLPPLFFFHCRLTTQTWSSPIPDRSRWLSALFCWDPVYFAANLGFWFHETTKELSLKPMRLVDLDSDLTLSVDSDSGPDMGFNCDTSSDLLFWFCFGLWFVIALSLGWVPPAFLLNPNFLSFDRLWEFCKTRFPVLYLNLVGLFRDFILGTVQNRRVYDK